MITLLQRLVGTRETAQKKEPTANTRKPAPQTRATAQEDWLMSADDALRAKTVSGYK